MKKAVILVGGKQYLVEEKETLRVDLLPEGTKELETDALLVIDGDKTTVGTPTVKGVKVSAKVKAASVFTPKLVIAKSIPKLKSPRSVNKISPTKGLFLCYNNKQYECEGNMCY